MALSALRTEERIGLAVAIAAHVALFGWLAWQRAAPPAPPPERMTVTLSQDVGLHATSPQPAPEAAPDKGPEAGEPAPVPSPQPEAAPPKPSVAAKAPLAPVKTPPKPQQHQAAQAKPSEKMPLKAGATRFDQAFAKGVPGAQGKNPAPAPAAAAFGPQQQSALRSAIFRQLKPHWVAPQGIDAEKLITVVRFRLDQSGRLVGEPVLVSQTGQTPSNAAQTRRHFEQAVRAIKLAQPFILPPDLFPYWQTVTSTFDKKLSQ